MYGYMGCMGVWVYGVHGMHAVCELNAAPMYPMYHTPIHPMTSRMDIIVGKKLAVVAGVVMFIHPYTPCTHAPIHPCTHTPIPRGWT